MRRAIPLDPSIRAYAYSPDCKWVLGERGDDSVVIRRVRGPPEKDIIVSIHKNCFEADTCCKYFIGTPRDGYDAVLHNDGTLRLNLQTGEKKVYRTIPTDTTSWINKDEFLLRNKCSIGIVDIRNNDEARFQNINNSVNVISTVMSYTGKYCANLMKDRTVHVMKFVPWRQYVRCYTVPVPPADLNGHIVNDGGLFVQNLDNTSLVTLADGKSTCKFIGDVRIVFNSADMIITRGYSYADVVWKIDRYGSKKAMCIIRDLLTEDDYLADDGYTLVTKRSNNISEKRAMLAGQWCPAAHAMSAICVAAVDCRKAIREAIRATNESTCETVCEAVFEANMSDIQ